MKEVIKSVETLEKWYNKLDEGTKDNTSIYCIVGDIVKGCNVDLISGCEKSLVVAMANSMVHSRAFYDVAKEAISLVDTHNALVLKEESEKLNLGNNKYYS